MRCFVRIIKLLFVLLLFCAIPVSAAQGPPPAKVVTAPLTREKVQENQPFIGLVRYDRASRISSDVAGLVKQVKVDAGDQVKAGDALLTLDTELLEIQIASQKTRVDQIELEIGLAEKNFSRLNALFAKEGISEKDLDDARYAVENSRLRKQQAEQELKQLKIRLRKSVVVAPFAGIVLAKEVESGVWVQQGRELLTLGASDAIIIRVPLAETQIRFIEKGLKVPVQLTAFGVETTGIMRRISPVADTRTKNVFVDVDIDSRPDLVENMSATVYFPVGEPKELAIISRDALIKFQGKDFVYTVKEGKASILPVNIVSYLGDTIGADNPYLVEGLPVVVEGNERLQPDKPVVAVEKK